MTTIKILRPDKSRIAELCGLHRSCFPNDLLSSMSTAILGEFYLNYINSSDPIFIAETVEGGLVGLIIGGRSDRLSTFRRSHIVKYLWAAFTTVISSPRRLWHTLLLFVDALTSKASIHCQQEQNAVLQVICVDIEHQGIGIAQMLVEHLLIQLRQLSYRKVTLTVNRSNVRAKAFYSKLGWRFVGDNLINSSYETELYEG